MDKNKKHSTNFVISHQIRDKMLDYEEEIESLNANLDTKNEFISALQKEIQQKNNDSNCFLTQLDNSRSIIK